MKSELENRFEELMRQGKLEEAYNYIKYWSVHCLNLMAKFFAHTDYDRTLKVLKFIAEMESNVAVLTNISCLLGMSGRLEEALEYSRKAVVLEGNTWETYLQHAKILFDSCHYEEALGFYKKCLELAPDNPVVHLNAAINYLILGNYEEGWKEYEWRFKAHAATGKFKERYLKPDWNGENIKNKKILVYNEQGMGDAIFYCRFLPLIKAKSVILEIQEPLAEVLQKIDGVDEIVTRAENCSIIKELPDHDFVVSLASLPRILGAKVNTKFPYIFPRQSKKKNDWDVPCDKKFKIGIVWAGSPDHMNDVFRSFRLKEFKSLSEVKNVQLFSFQKGPMERTFNGQYINLLEGSEGINIIKLGDSLNNVNDAANLINKMDLIIGVDTMLLHLAAAMGKPTWMILGIVHDFRWLASGENTHWYPSLKLFRQKKDGDWDSVLEEVVAELKGRNVTKGCNTSKC